MIITRKPHDCGCCGEEIPAGSMAEYYERRCPDYDDDDNQIGITYARAWYHPLSMLCTTPEPHRSNCLAGNHEYQTRYIFDHYAGEHQVYVPDGYNCKHCGVFADDLLLVAGF